MFAWLVLVLTTQLKSIWKFMSEDIGENAVHILFTY